MLNQHELDIKAADHLLAHYFAMKKQLKKNGATEEEAHIEALASTDRVTVKTEQSPDPVPSYQHVVKQLANLHHPMGYEVHPAAPSTLTDLRAAIEQGVRFKVSPDYCDNTIYTTPEANHASRAWHDIWHYYLDAEFDTQGETEVWKAQCRELVQRYRHHPNLIAWLELTTIEVLGQTEYFGEHEHFPPNQRLFAQACLLEGTYHDKALSFLTN